MATSGVDGYGNFDIALAPGTYRIKVAAYGYISDTRTDIEIVAGQTRRLGDAVMLRPSGNANTRIHGNIDDAATSAPLSEAVIRFRVGRDNTSGEYLRYSTGRDVVLFTDENGNYEFTDLPYGYYTMEVGRAGYTTSFRNIVAADGEEEQSFSLSRMLADGKLRVVLWWNEHPSDLDSHMVGPTPGGKTFHTWYSDKNAYEGNTVIADLDRDDTTSFGPETTTVRTEVDGTYYFFVHWYAGQAPFSGCGAWAQVYVGTELKATYYIPYGNSSYRYWNVFSYDSSTETLTEIGTLTEHPETGGSIFTDYSVYDELDGYAHDDYENEDSEVYSIFNEDGGKFIKAPVGAEKTEEYLEKCLKEDASRVPAA